jgi:hypothetical protein
VSLKTPNLLDVPKTGLSAREKLRAFKAAHGIETKHCPGMTRKEHPWLACLMPAARQFGYGVTAESDLFDCVEKVGRLLDEAGVLVTGETERDALRRLCECNDIPCAL